MSVILLLILFNVGISARAAFSQKIGPGKAYAGLKTDINLLSQTYTISGRKVNYGRVIFVAPVIGYTFILKEDKEPCGYSFHHQQLQSTY